MKNLAIGVFAVTCCVIVPTASADEVWDTVIGNVIYEEDLPNGDAVLSFPLKVGEEVRGLAFFHGLAGTYEGRGEFDGVWIEPDEVGAHACNVAIANPKTGEPVWNWGRAKITFVDPDFPGTWVARRANCFNEPDDYLVGRPIVGGE